jgi:hypothetical protein
MIDVFELTNVVGSFYERKFYCRAQGDFLKIRRNDTEIMMFGVFHLVLFRVLGG